MYLSCQSPRMKKKLLNTNFMRLENPRAILVGVNPVTIWNLMLATEFVRKCPNHYAASARV